MHKKGLIATVGVLGLCGMLQAAGKRAAIYVPPTKQELVAAQEAIIALRDALALASDATEAGYGNEEPLPRSNAEPPETLALWEAVRRDISAVIDRTSKHYQPLRRLAREFKDAGQHVADLRAQGRAAEHDAAVPKRRRRTQAMQKGVAELEQRRRAFLAVLAQVEKIVMRMTEEHCTK